MQAGIIRRVLLVSGFVLVSFVSSAHSEGGGPRFGGKGPGAMGPGGMGRMGNPLRAMGGACRADVEKLCAGKKGPEIKGCLDEQLKADKLSPECKEFQVAQKERRDLMESESKAVLEACKADVETHCKEDKIPLRCLHRKFREEPSPLSAACSSRVKESKEKMKALREKAMKGGKGGKAEDGRKKSKKSE